MQVKLIHIAFLSRRNSGFCKISFHTDKHTLFNTKNKEKSIKKDKAILVSTAKISLYFFNFKVYTSLEVENE